MRILLLLLLASVPLTETKPANEVLLMEIMDSVKEILNRTDAILSQHVKILPVGCSDETLCQAGVILKDTNLNHPMLLRRLFAYARYTGHHQCNVSASEEYTMRALFKQIQNCSQNRLFNLKHKHMKSSTAF